MAPALSYPITRPLGRKLSGDFLGGASVPSNALTLNGVPLTLNGLILTLGA